MLTNEQKIFLASSPEFDEVLQKDPVLAALDACKIDYDREKDLLHDVFRGTWTIAGVPVAPITPAIWSVLWVMKSPFVRRKAAAVRVIDVAVFLYLLEHGVNDLDFSTIEEKAKEEGGAYGLPEDAEAVAEEITEFIELAHAPLKMLPDTPEVSGDDDPVYDSDWLLSVASVAAREAGMKLEEAMFDLPLSVVYGLLVIRARKATPDKHYGKRSPEWVSKKELERVNELSEEFVARHFPASDKKGAN